MRHPRRTVLFTSIRGQQKEEAHLGCCADRVIWVQNGRRIFWWMQQKLNNNEEPRVRRRPWERGQPRVRCATELRPLARESLDTPQSSATDSKIYETRATIAGIV